MKLSQALRLPDSPSLALVGAGGKTCVLFQLARELAQVAGAVFVTATTHLHVDQIKLADSHWIAESENDLLSFRKNLRGVMLVTGPVQGDRTTGVNPAILSCLRQIQKSCQLPLLIEADGSRQRPLKAPGENEPAIPEFVELVVVVAGLDGLGKALDEEYVYRPEIYGRLSGLNQGETITVEALASVFTNPDGGLKNIPPGARRVAILNKADTPGLQAQAKKVAGRLLPIFQAVISTSLIPSPTSVDEDNIIHAVYEPVAGIILAGGGSSRFGKPKQTLDWQGKPFVRGLAETALTAGLSPVIVVTGAHASEVSAALADLPVIIANNPEWQAGQSTSIRTGLRSLSLGHNLEGHPNTRRGLKALEAVGAAIYLLSDQPQVTPTILNALQEEHARTLVPIVAPLVAGQRGNPVLFDQVTFPALMTLTGDVGGRAIFGKFHVNYLPWNDAGLLADIDTPDDYRKLINGK